jgi:hypothetical protein
MDNKGNIEQVYSGKEADARVDNAFGAVFAGRGQAVLFGSVDGCVLVWDRKKGHVVYGMDHGEGMVTQDYMVFLSHYCCYPGDLIQAVAVSMNASSDTVHPDC